MKKKRTQGGSSFTAYERVSYERVSYERVSVSHSIDLINMTRKV